MATPHIRDVPEPVAGSPKAHAGMSLPAYIAGEPAGMAARPVDAEIVRRLKARDRSQGPSTADILDAVTAGRR